MHRGWHRKHGKTDTIPIVSGLEVACSEILCRIPVRCMPPLAGGPTPKQSGFFMPKSIVKRAIMSAYCRGWIRPSTVLRMFARFDLRSA